MSTNAVTQQQFSDDLDSLNTKLGTYVSDVAAEVATLKQQNPAVDFSALDAKVQTALGAISSADPGSSASSSSTAAAGTDPAATTNGTAPTS